MRWLLVKDLQILRRSPLLVALLALYPIAVAVLVGLALSRSPDKPKVAVYNQVTRENSRFSLGKQSIDAAKYTGRLTERLDVVRVDSRREAVQKVESGDALGAIIIPADLTRKLQGGEQPTVRVFYNAEDPVKAQFVSDIIRSTQAEANRALSDEFTRINVQYIDLILKGGTVDLFGQTLDILGLEKALTLTEGAQRALPKDSPQYAALQQVIDFARLAIQNLGVSSQVLEVVGEPIKVQQVAVNGEAPPLTTFAAAVAVTFSLMFVTVLLAAGALALEREEHAFNRLVRGLVSRSALLAEKVGLSVACGLVLSLVMLAGLGIFVALDWGRFPLWLAGVIAGGVAFGALGVAIGGLAREVRVASLIAFMVTLPVAFLALVPSGAVGGGFYDAVRVVSALFPFKPTLDAMNAALYEGGGSVLGPVLHLLALAAGFGVIARLALRRFA